MWGGYFGVWGGVAYAGWYTSFFSAALVAAGADGSDASKTVLRQQDLVFRAWHDLGDAIALFEADALFIRTTTNQRDDLVTVLDATTYAHKVSFVLESSAPGRAQSKCDVAVVRKGRRVLCAVLVQESVRERRVQLFDVSQLLSNVGDLGSERRAPCPPLLCSWPADGAYHVALSADASGVLYTVSASPPLSPALHASGDYSVRAYTVRGRLCAQHALHLPALEPTRDEGKAAERRAPTISVDAEGRVLLAISRQHRVHELELRLASPCGVGGG